MQDILESDLKQTDLKLMPVNPMVGRLLNIHRLQGELTSSPYSHDVIELAMATMTSLPLSQNENSPLLWLIISGPPSSDKTNTILLFRDVPGSYYLDSLTENSFISGYVHPKSGEKPKDLLAELDQKCLIIKDLTTLFSLKDEKVKKILGDLQSIYDGEYSKFTGTWGLKSYTARFPLLACITPFALHKHHRYMSLIGSRFLFYRVLPLNDAELKEGFDLCWKTGQSKEKLKQLRNLVADHAKEMRTLPVELVSEESHVKETIEQLATFLARGRGGDLKRKSHDHKPGHWLRTMGLPGAWSTDRRALESSISTADNGPRPGPDTRSVTNY